MVTYLHLRANDVNLRPYPVYVSWERNSASSLLAHFCEVVPVFKRLGSPALQPIQWYVSLAHSMFSPKPLLF